MVSDRNLSLIQVTILALIKRYPDIDFPTIRKAFLLSPNQENKTFTTFKMIFARMLKAGLIERKTIFRDRVKAIGDTTYTYSLTDKGQALYRRNLPLINILTEAGR